MASYLGQADPGAQYDRYLAHNEQSTLHKFKETYWTTKQAVIKKLGKKEDAHVVASDAQLDAKLEVFKAIQTSCMDLLRALEKYQDKLCALSQEENGTGRFLKTVSQQDKTRAGKMMAAVGKSQSFSSQQRLALRVPLVRLYQEVETFRYRAISDTLMTINRMESARTEYRGALLWMKDISEEFDPDSYKQLEKFRKVQAQVKKTKARFDKLKLDTMQKIDLLAASRCNMFSHVLANYQTTLLHFWEKTSRTMTAVSESFKGYQYYEFNMLKELCEPTKKLAEQTGNRAEAEKEDDAKDGEETDEEDEYTEDEDLLSLGTGTDPAPPSRIPQDADTLLSLDPDDSFDALASSTAPHRTDLGQNGQQSTHSLLSPSQPPLLSPHPPGASHIPFLPPPPSGTSRLTALAPHTASTGVQPVTNGSTALREDLNSDLMELITFGEEERAPERGSAQRSKLDDGSMTNLLEEIDKEICKPAKKPGTEANDFLDFGTDEERTIDEIKLAQDQKFDLARGPVNTEKDGKKGKVKGQGNKDLLSDDLDNDELEKDDMTLLNEILNAPSSGEDEFTREWQAVFGTTPLSSTAQFTPVETDQSQSDFMPSSLLDLSAPMGGMSLTSLQGQGGSQMGAMGMAAGGTQAQQAMAIAAAMGQLPQQQPQQQQQQKSKPKKDDHAQISGLQDFDPDEQAQNPVSKADLEQISGLLNFDPDDFESANPAGTGQKTDMSAWFNLFADLDPLANPDAIGKRPEDISDA